MVFKRRSRRSVLRIVWEFLFPPGGWSRAFLYLKHRVRRLPDTPERIARGIWAGIFVTFTPFYGLHFLMAAVLARMMKGNMLASLMATFFGNPVTYVPIGLISLKTGHFLMGTELTPSVERSFSGKFVDAWRDLKHNARALFTDETPDWDGLQVFSQEIFLPFLIGGLIPGAITATICYMITLPLIRAYQKSRKRKIRAKFEAIKKMAAEKMERDAKHDGRAATAPGRQH